MAVGKKHVTHQTLKHYIPSISLPIFKLKSHPNSSISFSFLDEITSSMQTFLLQNTSQSTLLT